MGASEQWARTLIGHRLDLLRFEGGAVREVLAAYQGALGDVQSALERLETRPADTRTLDRLRALSGELETRVRELEVLVSREMASRAQEAADAERAVQRRRIAPVVTGAGVAWTVPPDRAVAQLWQQPIRVGLLDTTDRLRAAMGRGLARGAGVAEIVRMAAEGGAAVEGGRNRLTVIVRTGVQQAANEAAVESYRANVDVLSGMQWLATLDSRTCLLCAPRHGEVVPLSTTTIPPLHPRCRCFLAPVPRSAAEMGLEPRQRRLFDRQPSSAGDFGAWLKGQPAAAQREFFGSESRRSAWLGGAPLASFSDAGRVLPLGDLRRRTG